jgi:hypothetical protein
MASRGAVRLDRAAVAVWLSHLVEARSLGLRTGWQQGGL